LKITLRVQYAAWQQGIKSKLPLAGWKTSSRLLKNTLGVLAESG
jgi:hypothetical protein